MSEKNEIKENVNVALPMALQNPSCCKVESDSPIDWGRAFISYLETSPDAMRGEWREAEAAMWFSYAILHGMEKACKREEERNKRSRLMSFAAETWGVFKVTYVCAGTLAMFLIVAAWKSGVLQQP